ncbi:hypothetical protein HNV12_16980 [Methanococcoides sp. SA1]|nr:hypothetical protein [Methanococcoides sp. SA1]
MAGLIIACLQDLKRREIDNWLNLFLLFGGVVFIFYSSFFSGELSRIFLLGFLLLVMGLVMMLFYEGRVFAGGDARLLFAMTPLFLGVGFGESFLNVGIFILFLLISGSVYGLFYSGVLYVLNFKKVNVEMKKGFANFWIRFALLAGLGFFLGGFWNSFFFVFGLWALLFPLLYVFAKGLEEVSMIKTVDGKELREGDWLVEDVKVGGRVVKADYDGLDLKDIELLKNKKKVLIKDGLPFAPVFLIAFFGYVFLRSWMLGFF